jgi:hypothetical protein
MKRRAIWRESCGGDGKGRRYKSNLTVSSSRPSWWKGDKICCVMKRRAIKYAVL